MRWQIRDLLLCATLAAALLCAHRYFYFQHSLRWHFMFSVNLTVLIIATLASWRASPQWRHFWQAYALFGWVYIVFVLRGGFDVNTYEEQQAFQHLGMMGMVFSSLTAMAAFLFISIKPDVRNGSSSDKR